MCPHLLVGGEGIGLAPAGVEPAHEEAPGPLAQRVVTDQRLHLLDHAAGPAEGQVEGRPLLDGREAQLPEAGLHGQERGARRHIGVGLTAPQRQGGVVGGGRPQRVTGRRPAGVGHQVLGPEGVDLAALDREPVAGRLALDDGGAQHPAQVGHVDLQRLAGPAGQVVAPHALDQLVDLDDVVGPGDEEGEDQPLPRPAHGRIATPDCHPQRTQH
jgi:hypothetical protein